jgi:hypothetical protein
VDNGAYTAVDDALDVSLDDDIMVIIHKGARSAVWLKTSAEKTPNVVR